MQYKVGLLCSILDGSLVSFEEVIAVFFSSSRELTTSPIDTDWLVSTLPSISTWRNSRLTVLWPFVLGLSRPTVWSFFTKLERAGKNEVCVYSISGVSCCGYSTR